MRCHLERTRKKANQDSVQMHKKKYWKYGLPNSSHRRKKSARAGLRQKQGDRTKGTGVWGLGHARLPHGKLHSIIHFHEEQSGSSPGGWRFSAGCQQPGLTEEGREGTPNRHVPRLLRRGWPLQAGQHAEVKAPAFCMP